MIDHLRSRTLFRSPLVAVYDLDCCAPRGDRSAEEFSSGHSVVFPRSGVFIKHASNQDQLVAECTRVLFFNRYESYRVSHPVADGDSCTSIHFSQSPLVDFISSVDPSIENSPDRPFHSPAADCSTSITLKLHRLRHLLHHRQQADRLFVEEICALLLAESVANASQQRGVVRQPVRAVTRQAHRDLVDAVRVVLARRFRDKLSLGELARAVFSSPFHLARIFRRETGLSLHRQLTRLRLRHALEHLADGKPDLTMLALDLGFSSHAHFSHVFRSEFGSAPSEFSRQLSMRDLRGMGGFFKSEHATNGDRQHHR
jgi:AraC family transcriptional regulator